LRKNKDLKKIDKFRKEEEEKRRLDKIEERYK